MNEHMILEHYKNNIRRHIDGVIHVGAHFGESQEYYESLGAKHVVYIEAHPEVSKYLSHEMRDNPNVTVLNYAMGDVDGVVLPFHVASNGSASSSLLKPKDHLSHYPHIKFSKTLLMVEQRTLDSLDEEGLLPSEFTYNYMTIDTQGYEMQVIQGAKKSLESVVWMNCELNWVEMYEDCASADAIDKKLKEYGLTRLNSQTQFITHESLLSTPNSDMTDEIIHGGKVYWGDGFYAKHDWVEQEIFEHDFATEKAQSK